MGFWVGRRWCIEGINQPQHLIVMEPRQKDLVDYIRLIYERESQRDSRNGTTFWAIVIALVYVVWHLLELLSSNTLSLQELFKPFANIYLATLALIVCVSSSQPPLRRNHFDRRIGYNYSLSTFNWPLKTLHWLIAGIACTLAWLEPPLNGPLHWLLTYQHYYNRIFFCLCLGLVSGTIAIAIYQHTKKSEQPHASEFIEPNTTFQLLLSAILFLLSLEVFIANAVSVITTSNHNPSTGIATLVGFDITLAIFGLCSLVAQTNNKSNPAKLLRLERDVLIHSLDEAATLERLQDELFGHYVGSWIDRRLELLTNKAEKAIQHAEKAETLLLELDCIDPEYSFERTGRLDAFSNELKALLDAFEAEAITLSVWLSRTEAESKIHRDTFVQQLSQKKIEEIENLSTELGKRGGEINERIKSLRAQKKLPDRMGHTS